MEADEEPTRTLQKAKKGQMMTNDMQEIRRTERPRYRRRPARKRRLRILPAAAGILARSCWLIPASAAVFFQACAPEVWIPLLNIRISPTVFGAAAYLVLVMWATTQLFGGIIVPVEDRLWYNMLPVEVFLTLAAMKTALYPTLLAIAFGLLIAVLFSLRAVSALRPTLRASRRFVRGVCLRITAVVMASVLTYPSMIALSDILGEKQLDSVRMLVSRTAAEAPAEDAQAPEIDEARWLQYSLQQRLNFLQRVVNTESAEMGIEPPRVMCTGLGCDEDSRTLGHYDERTREIVVDISHLETGTCRDLLKTILHECRHAYQVSVVAMLDWTDETVLTHQFFEEARRWKACFDDPDYPDAVFDAYYVREVEVDARAYAEECVEMYLSDAEGA